jgi:hypothetical protein
MNVPNRLAWLPMAAWICAGPLPAAAQVADARQMSGIAMPSPDVPAGSVTVRLVRGDLTNNIVSHSVEIRVGESVQSARTDANGRAVFTGLAGRRGIRAAAIVDGERLESQPFEMPPAVGLRLVLVASAAASSGAAATPGSAPGEVVFAGDSRIQIEFDDDALEVFYLLDLVNTGTTAVAPKAEIAFRLPEGAEQASVLEGGSTQVTVRGRQVVVTGPIGPGVTPIRLAYSLAPAGERRVITQALPVKWARVQVIMTLAGKSQVSSPVLTSANEMTGDGQSLVVATGAALDANRELVLTLTGLPSRSRLGQYVALTLGALVLLLGAYGAAAAGGRSGDSARRAGLTERRDRLMADLVRIEEQYRAGVLDANRYAARHEELVGQLERVYGELDSGAAGFGQGQPA